VPSHYLTQPAQPAQLASSDGSCAGGSDQPGGSAQSGGSWQGGNGGSQRTSSPPGPGAFSALGAKTEYRYEEPDASVLEAFANPSPSSEWAVSLFCEEFTSLCPVTGQPDYGRLVISYVPGARCVESKSLKLYLMRYRNEGTFHEACVNQVADDLFAVLAPRYLRVYGDFNSRGGIAIKPLAVRASPGLSKKERERCMALLDEVGAANAASSSLRP
jgi:7-cyano-7-deazaguanine reductase